jgi:hypothetical protein
MQALVSIFQANSPTDPSPTPTTGHPLSSSATAYTHHRWNSRIQQRAPHRQRNIRSQTHRRPRRPQRLQHWKRQNHRRWRNRTIAIADRCRSTQRHRLPLVRPRLHHHRPHNKLLPQPRHQPQQSPSPPPSHAHHHESPPQPIDWAAFTLIGETE